LFAQTYKAIASLAVATMTMISTSMLDRIRHVWYWFKSGYIPHRCENWQTYLGGRKSGVMFCNMCGKILDEHKDPNS